MSSKSSAADVLYVVKGQRAKCAPVKTYSKANDRRNVGKEDINLKIERAVTLISIW